MDNSRDDLNLNYSEVAVNELWYLESIINGIEDYFEYLVDEEETRVSDTTTKILKDISSRLYQKSQEIRKSTGLPNCLVTE